MDREERQRKREREREREKALKEKAYRALYAVKRTVWNLDIPIKIWGKIFDCVIQPIVLFGSEVWGPLSEHS